MSLRRYSAILLMLYPLLGCAQAASSPEDNIRARFKDALPDAKITSIQPAALAGFYEVQAQGFEPVYASGDGRFLLQGQLLEIRGKEIVNLSEEASMVAHKEALAAVKREDMIIFPAKDGKAKAAVYVFTDVDCGYCRKLHKEVPELNAMGIEVRYLAYPRTGLKSPTATAMEQIWCSTNRNAGLTAAKLGESVARDANCKTQVIADQYALGNRLGVRGTPAIFLEDGRQVGGYVPAAELAKRLKLK